MKRLTRPTITNAIAVIGFSTLSSLAIAPAQAVVIDFESLATNYGGYVGSSYTESGFTVTSSYDPYPYAYAVNGPNSIFYTGSTAIANVQGYSTTTLTQVGGGAFTLKSIDLADYGNARGYYNIEYVNVDFIGNLVGGGIVKQSFTTDSLPGLETFNFTNFTNLTSVKFVETGSFPNFQFDNINVSSTNVPEPFTILGTLTGAGASVSLRQRLSRRDEEDIQ
jgi:hypothetical protein